MGILIYLICCTRIINLIMIRENRTIRYWSCDLLFIVTDYWSSKFLWFCSLILSHSRVQQKWCHRLQYSYRIVEIECLVPQMKSAIAFMVYSSDPIHWSDGDQILCRRMQWLLKDARWFFVFKSRRIDWKCSWKICKMTNPSEAAEKVFFKIEAIRGICLSRNL